MKLFNLILEILTSPFSVILRNSGGNKSSLQTFAKPLIIFFVAIVIVIGLVLYFYKDFIFGN